MWEHQITTLRALFPFLRNGGYYVVRGSANQLRAPAVQISRRRFGILHGLSEALAWTYSSPTISSISRASRMRSCALTGARSTSDLSPPRLRHPQAVRPDRLARQPRAAAGAEPDRRAPGRHQRAFRPARRHFRRRRLCRRRRRQLHHSGPGAGIGDRRGRISRPLPRRRLERVGRRRRLRRHARPEPADHRLFGADRRGAAGSVRIRGARPVRRRRRRRRPRRRRLHRRDRRADCAACR